MFILHSSFFILHSEALLLAAITLGAFALRLWGIGSLGDLDFDEQASFFIGSMPPGEMLAYLLAAPFEHPPLFYLVFHAWLLAVGGSEAAMRAFAVFPGTLAVPVVGAAVGRMAGPRGAIVAAAVLALAPLHVYYSRDARMYSLLSLWMALAVYAVSSFEFRVSSSEFSVPTRNSKLETRNSVALLMAAGVAALATHYYAAVIVVSVAIAFALARRRGWGRRS